MSVGNITIRYGSTKETNAANTEEAVEKIKTLQNNGQAINSISYKDADGTIREFTKEDAINFLKGLENFDQTIDPTKLTEEMVKKLGDGCKDVLKALGTFIDYVASELNLSKEKTEDDIKDQAKANQLINKLLNGTFTDFDMRELMKLLIKAFSELMTSQREITLQTIHGIIDALNAKIEAMEKSRDENYNAAIAQAVGQIISGCIQCVASCFAIASACSAAKTATDACKLDPNTLKAELTKNTFANISQEIMGLGNGFGGMATGFAGIAAAAYQYEAKTADMDSTKQDAIMEVYRKMQEENTNQLKQLLDFINTLLRVMQELQQNASSTEQKITA